MTTEVLRNMIYAASPTLEGLRYVVLDEVHYLQNPYRGAVWEEVIIHLAPEVDLVCLSATVSNAEEFADWIQTVRGETEAVIEERRPVRLRHLYLVGDKEAEGHPRPAHLRRAGPTPRVELRPNPEAPARFPVHPPRAEVRGPAQGPPVHTAADRGRRAARRGADAAGHLLHLQPGGCDQAVDACLAAGIRLTDAGEREQIRAIAAAHLDTLSDADLELLGYSSWMAGLEAGFAAHHAGMVPPMKEAVEEGFAAGLVKVVFATETLSLGINMPARTVVIEKLSKFTGERHEFLTPGEYTQLTGRAGRRGIDDLGYAAVLWNPYVPFDQVAALASTRSYALQSSFRPTYNMAANLVRRYPPDVAHHLLNLSFAQYGADKEIVKLERQLERSRELLASHRQAVVCERGDVEEYRPAAAQPGRGAGPGAARAAAAGFDALKPGDVISRRGNKAVVLQRTRGRGDEVKLLVLTADRGMVRLGSTDFAGPVRPIGAIELPRPFAPAARPSAGRWPTPSGEVRAGGDGRAGPTGEPPGTGSARGWQSGRRPAAIRWPAAATWPSISATPSGPIDWPATSSASSAASGVAPRAWPASSTGCCGSSSRGATSTGGSSPTPGTASPGSTARPISCVAESLREGLLDGLDGPSMAAVASVFTYETRGPAAEAGAANRVRFPNRKVRDRVLGIERIWRDLNVVEDEAGLPETRTPDAGFAAAAHAWAAGKDLDDVLLDEDLTGGDFVRNVKQLIDLLRQIGDVARGGDVGGRPLGRRRPVPGRGGGLQHGRVRAGPGPMSRSPG